MNTMNRHWVQSSPLLLIFTFTSKLCFLFSLSPECTSAPHLAPELPATYEEYFDFLQWRSPARFFVWPNALLACWREIGWYSMNNSTDVRLLRPSEGVVQLCFSLFHSSVLPIDHLRNPVFTQSFFEAGSNYVYHRLSQNGRGFASAL